MGRRCVCCANVYRACPIGSGLILFWRPPMRRPDNLTRRKPKSQRCFGSTRGSQLKDTNVLSSCRTPRRSIIVLTGCARRGCPRLELRYSSDKPVALVANFAKSVKEDDMWTHFLAYIAGVATGPLIVGLAVGGFVGMYGGALT